MHNDEHQRRLFCLSRVTHVQCWPPATQVNLTVGPIPECRIRIINPQRELTSFANQLLISLCLQFVLDWILAESRALAVTASHDCLNGIHHQKRMVRGIYSAQGIQVIPQVVMHMSQQKKVGRADM